MNFKEALELLPSPNFMRVHRSFIINLEKIELIEGNRIYLAGKEVKISNTYRNVLLEYLSKNNLLK